MTAFKEILFVGDGTGPDSPNGLRQAMVLAGASGAKLTVLDVVAEVTTNDPDMEADFEKLQGRLIAERVEALEAAAGGGPVVPEIRVVPGKHIVEIVRAVSVDHPDLVIKSAISSRLGHMIWGALDLKLMRACPAPVWLMREDQAEPVARVVAAVDALGDSGIAKAVLRLAAEVAALQSAELHVITVTPTDLWLDPRLGVEAAGTRLRSEVRERFDQLLATLVAPYTSEVLEGDPARLILDYANPDDLVVAGTVARRGLQGFLMGNTAEEVFNALKTSVLAVKPDSFESPIAVLGD